MCRSLRRLPGKGALGRFVAVGRNLGWAGSVTMRVYVVERKGQFDLLSRNCSVASGAEARCSGLLDKIIL